MESLQTTTVTTALSDAQLDALLERRAQEKAEKEKQERDAYLCLREELVISQAKRALEVEQYLKTVKTNAFNEFTAFAELVRVNENKKDSWKNNFELKSLDGNFKIVYARQQLGDFDERKDKALEHIKTFLDKSLKDIPYVKQLVEKLLEQRNGKLDVKLVQKLYTMETAFTDADWIAGIKLLKESYVESDTCDYIRFYEKVEANKWRQIKLDFASV